MDFNFRAGGFHRTIKYRGVFDFDGFYKYVVKWIKDHDYDFYEKKVWDYPPYRIHYLEGRKKISFMTMFYIRPEIWVWDMKPVEIVKDGVVKHLVHASMKVVIDGGFIIDYDGDFEKSPGLVKIREFLIMKIMYHEMFIKWYDYSDYFLHDFMTDLKKYLEMETATSAY